jgi:hypothetical protein
MTAITHQDNWLYDNPICTGLGDRIGIIIALSALASLHSNSTNQAVVHMEWCTEPERVLVGNHHFRRWVPGWTGFDFPIEALLASFILPANVRLYATSQPPMYIFRDQRVLHGGPVPAWEGTSQTSTLYCKSLRMERDLIASTQDCEMAYKEAGKQIRVRNTAEDIPYVLVHFRSPDDNTCRQMRDEKPFCTHAVLRELHQAGLYMKVISNNHSFSMQWLRSLPFSVQLIHGRSACQYLALALSATAIVQHSATGWSSYTSVPAMARGIPLINTYDGLNHRFDLFASYGAVPQEFHSCRTGVDNFVRAARQACLKTGHC